MGFFDFFYNAATGNLSQSQVDAIKDETDAGIAQASKGSPAVVAEQQKIAQNEIDSVLSTFSLPGESKADAGASPGQATLRLPLIGKATIQNVEAFRKQVTWAVIGLGVIVGAVLLTPYVAPSLRKAIKSVKRG